MKILDFLGMYFDAVVVEVKTFYLLFIFALAILCGTFNILQIFSHSLTNCEFNFPTFFRFDRLNSHLLLNRNSWKIPLKYFRKLLFCRHQTAKRDDITILQEFYVEIHTIHFKNSDRKNRWLSKNIFVSYRPPLPFSK